MLQYHHNVIQLQHNPIPLFSLHYSIKIMSCSSTLHFILYLFLFCSSSSAQQQLSLTQARNLFRIQRALEYPPALNGWNRYTNFCNLPKTANLSIACSNTTITELLIVGDKPNIPCAPRTLLSTNFSSDSLFRTLSRLPTITNLTLVSLGMWGTLPPKIDRLGSLEVLNLSSNFLYGSIPIEISGLKMLKRLDLSRNFLQGSVPDLTGLGVLQKLDLGINRLGPEFPTTSKVLVSLVLRNNSFRANLSVGLENMNNLEVFDVSYNKLFGKIPSFLFSLQSIRYLELSGNRFTGTLPDKPNCGTSLGFVDISRNKLVGQPPACLRSNRTNVTVMYSWNCLSSVASSLQNPASYCNEDPLAVMPNSTKTEGKRSKNVLDLLLGIAGGVAGGAILVALILIVVTMKTKTTRDDKDTTLTKSVPEKTSIHIIPAISTTADHMSQEVRLGMFGLMPYRVFEMKELEEATDNFDKSNLLQETPQVQLYRGRMQDGYAITIRCLRLKQKHSPQVLLQYIDAFSKLRHRHLVSILGHCIVESKGSSNASTTTIYLAFEHVTNGTLRSHLTEWRRREMLKWPQRVAVAIGVARGIQFLHTVNVPGIYGNNLNTDNILLDQTLTAKIYNYNLPMALKGKSKGGAEFPFSVLERKDINRLKNGDKEDIYQLGLILMEVITGKPATAESELDALKHKMQDILTNSEVDVQSLTDPTIHGTFAFDSLKTIVEVALNCLSKDLSKRPSVDDVLWNLLYSLQVQDGCASSEGLIVESN